MGCKYMGKLKRALVVLVLIFFVMSLTVASASACEEKKCDCKNKYDCDKKYDFKDKCDFKDKYNFKDKCGFKDKCDFKRNGFNDCFSFDFLWIFFGDIFDCGKCFSKW